MSVVLDTAALIALDRNERAMWARLKALNCDLAQGFYLSRPIPAEQLRAWLAGQKIEAASSIPQVVAAEEALG